MTEVLFPLVINFQGDYGMKLLMVDPDATIDDVARLASDQLTGVVVKRRPEGVRLRVRRHQDDVFLDGTLKVGDAGFVRMEALDIVYT